jgi:hypothetical protein
MDKNKQALLKALRAELLKQGFDASHLDDTALEKWCNENGIEILAGYKVYTKQNTADTTRDPDNYVYGDIGNTQDLNEAIKMANDYIKSNFFRKDKQLTPGEGDIVFSALDFCSYPVQVIIEKDHGGK